MEGARKSPELTEAMEGKTEGTEESSETSETNEGDSDGSPAIFARGVQMTSVKRMASEELWSDDEELYQCGEASDPRGSETLDLLCTEELQSLSEHPFEYRTLSDMYSEDLMAYLPIQQQSDVEASGKLCIPFDEAAMSESLSVEQLENPFPDPSPPQHPIASKFAMIDMDWILELELRNEHLFTPDVEETSNMRQYRFQAKHPGRWFCRITGLGFAVESSGEVTYSFCSWGKGPKTPGSWSPAGPLFDIECPQGTLKELHLPHCEMTFADEDLAVAHITKDNMEILQPQEVSVKYIVISVTSLSGFGVIKNKESSKVRGQVLLLLRPKPKILNVFLLPLNVPPDQVHQQEQHRQNIFIPTSSMCRLVHKRRYRMSCNHEAIRRIQPENEKFEYSFDQTIHPTFEVFLNHDVMEAELSVLENRSSKVVWQRFIDLTGAVPPSSSTTEGEVQPTGVAFVDQHRESIVQRVSLIEPILDELHKHIAGEKYDYICAAKTRQNKFRRLYDVLNCGKLKMLFFEALKKKEPHLFSELESSNVQIIHSESKCC